MQSMIYKMVNHAKTAAQLIKLVNYVVRHIILALRGRRGATFRELEWIAVHHQYFFTVL